MVWESSSNCDKAETFDVDADVASEGSFKADFEAATAKLGLENVCPFVAASSSLVAEDSEEVTESVRVTNCKIDRASWRAMLLAAIATGCKVNEICVVGCELTPGHVEDLCKALGKLCTIGSVKMDYISFSPTEPVEGAAQAEEGEQSPSPASSLVQLLGPALGLSYVSLKGCGFTPREGAAIAEALPLAPCLSALNLSANQLMDAGMQAVLKAASLAPALQYLSLAHNKSESFRFVVTAGELLFGRRKDDGDDAVLAAGAASVSTYNKGLKDLGKKRKKAGLDDLPEMVAAEGRVCAVTLGEEEGVELVVHRGLRHVDLSGTGVADTATKDALSALVRAQKDVFGDDKPLECTLALGGLGIIAGAALNAPGLVLKA